MPYPSEIFEKIQGIMVKELGIHPLDVKGNFELVNDLGADSLSLMAISQKVEDIFGLSIEIDSSIKTVDDLVSKINSV